MLAAVEREPYCWMFFGQPRCQRELTIGGSRLIDVTQVKVVRLVREYNPNLLQLFLDNRFFSCQVVLMFKLISCDVEWPLKYFPP